MQKVKLKKMTSEDTDMGLEEGPTKKQTDFHFKVDPCYKIWSVVEFKSQS